jgi:hypothetical protein
MSGVPSSAFRRRLYRQAARETEVVEREKGQTQGALLHWFRHAPMPMARSREQLFSLLAFYTPRSDWADFVKLIDFSGVTPSWIIRTVLGRSPDCTEIAVGGDSYDPADHFREALLSPEFRGQIQRIFLQAFRAKGRDIFIHVPKCAGTDLILNLGRRSVPLPKMLELSDWVDETEFLEIIGGLARAAVSKDRLFAYGHMVLGEFVQNNGLLPDDRIFTVLRDPIDLLISQANYAVGRLRQDPLGDSPDTAQYLRTLGLARLPEDASQSDLKTLTLKALLNPDIAAPNRACFYLGQGNQSRYATAMENLIVHDVEITTTQHYNRWLNER